MAWSRSVIEKRRDVVQREALRGKSTRQIEAMFAKAARESPIEARQFGMVNPDTDEAWDHSTIARDLTYLEKQWREDAQQDRVKYKAAQIAELREHRKAAWQASELGEVRLSIKAEMELTGTKSVDVALDIPLTDLTDDQLKRIIQGEDPLVVLATASKG